MRVLPIAATVAALGVASCAHSDFTEAQRQVIATSVDSAMRAFAAAERALDARAMLAHFTGGTQFRVYNDGQRVDYETLAAQLPAGFATLSRIEGGFENIEVTVLSPSAALASATFREAVTDTAGTTVRTRGAVTWIWVRRDHAWKIVYGQADHLPDSMP